MDLRSVSITTLLAASQRKGGVEGRGAGETDGFRSVGRKRYISGRMWSSARGKGQRAVMFEYDYFMCVVSAELLSLTQD